MNANSWDTPEDEENGDVFAAELEGEPGPEGANPVAREIGGWIARAIESVRDKLRRRKGLPPTAEPSQGSVVAERATATAVGALEGKLKSSSLEGVLKEASILDAYASARQKNAEAEKTEVETSKLRQDMAFERLERVIELCERLGAPVKLVELPNGHWGIAAGNRVITDLPDEIGLGEAASLLILGEIGSGDQEGRSPEQQARDPDR